MSAQVTKLYASVRYADAKARTFGAIGAQQYADVWAVHEMEVLELLRQFGRIDGRISERLLCLRVERTYVGQASDSEAGQCRMMNRRRPHTTAGLRSSPLVEDIGDDGRLIEVILSRIATHTEWLQDRDLDAFFNDDRMDAAAKRLIRIDHVLNALGLANDVRNLPAMMSHFGPHVFCERCKLRPGQEPVVYGDQVPVECNGRHTYVVDGTLVVPTLRRFVEAFYQQYSDSVAVSNGVRSEMNEEDIWCVRRNQPNIVEEFWKAFVAKVPTHYGRLWAALEIGMSKYLQVKEILSLLFQRWVIQKRTFRFQGSEETT